ncbi:hypothetical protein CC86DRAFT_371695 [Ophiobolus disseminans]|uniref:Uncharacterized protein n=1 Tax=Ophiobolus disseminans TaxID=1469910 RepID=A0A6A6ZTF3_9PLEO|nr:hypothetical protein CC86DRAFT_371695 [Ophiobolus disseminans]
MQLITFLSAAAAAVATASADSADASVRNAVTLNKSCDKSKPYARIINRCDYTVNLWSVLKGQGCPTAEMVTLKKGEVYAENYAYAKDTKDGRGVSIKISKTKECKGNDITQLEYFLDNRDITPKAFQLNYLDVSYVDCVHDCPTKKEGYYLAAGSSTARTAKTAADGSWCPVLSCSDAASCAKMSYILPDDVQTKTCDLESSMDFYMCGSQPPSGDDETPASQAPASSSKQVETPAAKPSTTLKAVVSSAANYKVNVAAVTNAPKIEDVVKAPKVKTKVVYVTAYEYANAKRSEHVHAHAHARRHQPFNA